MMTRPRIFQAVAIIIGGLLGSAPAVRATVAQQPIENAGYFPLHVGDFEITALSDGAGRTPKDSESASVNGFLINTGTKLVLIDTGAGTLLGPGVGALVGNLRAAGYKPEQIDEIYITRMIPSHAGGLLSERKAAFPGAVVRASLGETGYWLARSSMAAAPVEARQRFAELGAAFKPYMIAGRLKTFDREAEIAPGVRALPTAADTPGPTVYIAESRGEKIVFIGDEDPHAPAAARIALFEDAAAHGDWVAGARRSFPGIGHVRRAHRGFEWMPLKKPPR